MENIEILYNGNLMAEAVHTRSGTVIETDAPIDNQGKGSRFSPTDLLATSLASCMLTVMGIAARNYGFSIEGTRVRVGKIMASDPRRVCEIVAEFDFPPGIDNEKHRKILEYCTRNCPVAHSVHPDIRQTIKLNF